MDETALDDWVSHPRRSELRAWQARTWRRLGVRLQRQALLVAVADLEEPEWCSDATDWVKGTRLRMRAPDEGWWRVGRSGACALERAHVQASVEGEWVPPKARKSTLNNPTQ